MAKLLMRKVRFSYGDELVVDNLDLEVQDSEILTVVGPSGCGKSTFLRLIAGLLSPQSGQISLRNSRRGEYNLRFVFQDYDAFPWYTVWENVKRSAPKNSHPTDESVMTILQRVGLWNSRYKYPAELSGGMRKRLALGRCLVVRPDLLLLDEPFSKLDIDTRYEMYELVQELWQETQQTAILVTHDLQESIMLGTRILVSTALPFQISRLVTVPFSYPRRDSITTCNEYTEILQSLREALRVSSPVRKKRDVS